jgi:hypothetical protein
VGRENSRYEKLYREHRLANLLQKKHIFGDGKSIIKFFQGLMQERTDV